MIFLFFIIFKSDGMKSFIIRDEQGRFIKGIHASSNTEFKKGHKGYITRPWLGKQHTEESKLKRRISCKEWWQNSENKRKVKRLRGSEHPQWKGGITEKNHLRRRTEEYKQWQKTVFKRDNWTCQNCHNKLKHLIAHHKKTVEKYPELIYNIDNGITLCRSCHKKLHKEIGFSTRFQSRKVEINV